LILCLGTAHATLRHVPLKSGVVLKPGESYTAQVESTKNVEIEVVEDWRGNAYRAVYTVRYASAVCVLHCFQKKSKRGVATPQHELELVRERLKQAETQAREVER